MAKLKLSAKYQQEVDHSLEFNGGHQTFLEYYAAEQAEHMSAIFKNSVRRFEHLSHEQRVADATAGLISGHFLLSRGYAKRLAEDAPQELAYSASIYTRLEMWHGTQDQTGECQIDFADLLRALAAGDKLLVERVASAPPETYKYGPYETKFLVTSILAATLRDEVQLASAIAEYEKLKKPKLFVTCMHTIFRGMLERDASLTTEGLEALLKVSRKIQQLFDIFKIISLEMHGMYELCRWYDPTLVKTFDTDRKLPWDRGLCDWVRDNAGKPKFYNVSQLSPELQRWLEELPLGDGRDHFWPDGASDSSLREKTGPEPEQPQTPPAISFSESWNIVLTKHVKKEHDEIYDLCDTLFENEDRVRSYGTMSHDEKLPLGEYSAPREPWVVCLSRENQPWFLVDGAPIDDAWIKKNGKRKRVQTIRVGYDAEKSHTFFRMYEAGKIHVDFVANGPPDQTGSKVRLKSQVPLDDCVSEDRTPADMLDALLRRFDAREMLLRITENDHKLRLEWQDRTELRPALLRDSNEFTYYALAKGDNAASDLLEDALYEGDPAKVQAAVDAGASLEWLPLSSISPLSKVVVAQRGDWKACAKALVNGGAPVDGYVGEIPPTSVCYASSFLSDAKGLGQPRAIEVIDTLLELGADINAINTTNTGAGNTPLLHAADNCQPLVVAHLLMAGADVEAKNHDGKTALDLARNRAENYYAEAKQHGEQIVEMLKNWQSGTLSPAELKQFVAEEQQRNQRVIDDDQWRRVAKMVLLQTKRIEIAPLSDFGDPEHAKPMVADLEACGFEKIGYFNLQADAVKLRLIAFHHPSRYLYGLVIIVARTSFCNLMRFHKNETACNVANAEFSNDFSPRATSPNDLPVRYYVVPDGTVSQLLDKMDSLPVPSAGIDEVSPDQFTERLHRHHELDVEGQHRIAKAILGKD